ncbi:hypothetical protein A167_02767 [Alcanivorax sp. S71-1-4]|jgi:predicted branched-subunit amino acid permease|uniref:hypothetical protein n=1 Tax=Alcanivorax sp. S71-1-4 TaxID=1177159 RepID=UPI001357445B|nr:hypothetical protein [Alcanivorax sp. S71-1-4]KAF0807893.1 hypothetical protein A167_02767 [Alcanivorax sp. S71-1-4]
MIGVLSALLHRDTAGTHTVFMRVVWLSWALTLAGALLASLSISLQLIGMALFYGAIVTGFTAGAAALYTHQRGACTGLVLAALIPGLLWLEPWLPPAMLDMLHALAL